MGTEGEEPKPPVETLNMAERAPLRIPDLTLDSVRNATYFSRQHLEEWFANAERAWVDEDREIRLEAQQCRWCFYARGSRMVMNAFYQRGCEACKKVQSFSSSHTTPICKPCAQERGLCVECRADISLADRRKLERKLPPDHQGGRKSPATLAKEKSTRRSRM